MTVISFCFDLMCYFFLQGASLDLKWNVLVRWQCDDSVGRNWKLLHKRLWWYFGLVNCLRACSSLGMTMPEGCGNGGILYTADMGFEMYVELQVGIRQTSAANIISIVRSWCIPGLRGLWGIVLFITGRLPRRYYGLLVLGPYVRRMASRAG